MKLRLVDTASAGVPAYWALAACQTRGPFRATGARLPGSPGMRLGSEADWCLPIAAEPDIEAAEELRRSGQDTAKIRAQRSALLLFWHEGGDIFVYWTDARDLTLEGNSFSRARPFPVGSCPPAGGGACGALRAAPAARWVAGGL